MKSERNDDETVLEGSGNVFADLGLQMSDDDMLKVVIARAITRIVHAGRYTQRRQLKLCTQTSRRCPSCFVGG